MFVYVIFFIADDATVFLFIFFQLFFFLLFRCVLLNSSIYLAR